MKNSSLFSILISLLILVSCAGDGSKSNVKKLADGVYQKEGWIYDMKELPSGKMLFPFILWGLCPQMCSLTHLLVHLLKWGSRSILC